MSAQHHDSATETREKLEQEADAVRARLESRIDAVKDKGRQVTHALETAKAQAKRHAPVLIVVGGAALLVTTVLTLRNRARDRQRERGDAILQIATSLLAPGYSMQRPEPKPGFLKSSLTNIGKRLLTIAAHELGRRAIDGLVPVAAARISERAAAER